MEKSENQVLWTPHQLAVRWSWHAESIRRKIRRGEIASIIISRRRLIPFAEILRIEADGTIPAASDKFKPQSNSSHD
jgi:hypothetical protein